MFKNLFPTVLLSFVLLFFTACVGQPTAPVSSKSGGGSSVLWDEGNSQNEDRDDNVDVSDLDKSVESGGGSYKRTEVPRIPFPAEEYNALPRTGKGTVKGRIYVENYEGNKIPGAKTRLYLNPVTSYSRQWYEQSYIDGNKMGKADSRLFNYLRFTASDEEGNFAFYGVPSGRYYLIGTVVCGEECGYRNKKSFRIAKEVSVVGNEVVEQDLSKIAQ